MGSKVIYTCITDGYDVLSQPSILASDYDWLCFADEKTMAKYGGAAKVGVWQMRPIPYRTEDKLVAARYPKLQPHKVLAEYEWSLWVDANIDILGDGLLREAERCMAAGDLVSQVRHPFRGCVYEELRELERQERLPMRLVLKEMHRLRKAGFPEGYGQYENNLILRRHMDPAATKLSDLWWEEFLAFPHRDQVSLMFVYWKEGFQPGLLLPEGVNARNAGYLSLRKHPNAPTKRHGLAISAKRAAKLLLRPVLLPTRR